MTDFYQKAIDLCKQRKLFLSYLEEHHRQQLLGLKKMGVEKVEILSAGHGNSCQKCFSMDGKVLSIEEALKTMPLPVKDCATDVFEVGRGFCRCTYSPSA